MSLLMLVYLAGAMVMGYLIIRGGSAVGNNQTREERKFLFSLAAISAMLWPLAMVLMIAGKDKD